MTKFLTPIHIQALSFNGDESQAESQFMAYLNHT